MKPVAKPALKLAAILLPLALLAGVGWALGTTAGLRMLLARTDVALTASGPPTGGGAAAAGGGLRVAEVRGSVLGGAELDGIELAHGATRVSVAQLRAELHPWPLLVGKLALARLELDGVRVVLPAEPDPTPIVLPERIELPVRIAIDRFAVRDLEVAAGASPLLALDAVEARASADARGFRIEDARIAAAGLRADGSLALANAQPYPMEGALRLRLERPNLPPVAGNVQLSGRLEALRLAIGLDAPLAARATLALDDPFGAKRVSGRVTATNADLAPIFGALAGWRFDADLALDGTLAAPRIDGTLGARHPDLPPLRAALGARRDGRVILLERLAVTAAGSPAKVDAKGRFTLDSALPFVVDMRASHPLLPAFQLGLHGDLARAQGRLHAEDRGGVLDAALEIEPAAVRGRAHGTLSAWPLPGGIALGADSLDLAFSDGRAEFKAAGSATRGTLRAGYTLAGKSERARIAIESLELALLDGHASGHGTLELGGTQACQATLRLHDLDPRGLDPRFPGRLDATLALSGSFATPTIAISDLDGELRGRRIAGHAKLHHGRAPELVAAGLPAFVLDELELVAGTAKLSAHANASEAALALEAPDLADLMPQARGRLELRGARGSDGALGGSVVARGAMLAAARVTSLDAHLRLPAAGRIEGHLEAAGLVASDLALDRLLLDASGERSSVVLALEANSAGTGFAGTAQGALEPDGFHGELARWELAPVDAARWTLAKPAALRVGRNGVALASACVSDGVARACLDGGWHPLNPWRATLAVSDLALAAFRSYLPRGLVYAGDLDLDAHVEGRGPTLGTVRAELQLSSGSIEATVRRASKAPASRLIAFSGGKVLLEHDAQRLRAHADLRLDAGGHIEAELEARGDGPFDARPLSGRVGAQVEQFALLPVMLPEVKQLSGRLDADLKVSGTVGAPRFAGVAGFHGGRASVPRYGVDISAVELTLKGDGDALDVEGSAQAGGTLGWKARLRRGADGWSADGTIVGDGFRALNTPEARVVASPDLAFAYAGDRLTVTGSVTVPSARIAPRSLTSALQASSDEVLVGGEDAPVEGALALDARVHVALGSDVDFEGFGLKAGIEGGLTLTEKPDSLTLASGELELVDGKYEAYGQLLAIKRGKLLFTGGPVTDPGLDVRAQRVIERGGDADVTVGIDARGTLRRPEILLYSDPAMSSSEQLSYLVLGRSLTESTEGDKKMLGDAAQSMKLSGGELLAQQIGRRIGLDEVKIEDQGDQREAQLWLGTYLSPRLFVSYGVGLFEDFYSARVRYDISTKWTVEAESGRESSADFKYTIER